MNNGTKALIEDIIAKTEILRLLIQKDPDGLNARAFLDISDAILSLKLLEVELTR